LRNLSSTPSVELGKGYFFSGRVMYTSTSPWGRTWRRGGCLSRQKSSSEKISKKSSSKVGVCEKFLQGRFSRARSPSTGRAILLPSKGIGGKNASGAFLKARSSFCTFFGGKKRAVGGRRGHRCPPWEAGGGGGRSLLLPSRGLSHL